MADVLGSLLGNYVRRFKDMGDGTWAEVVSAGGSGTTASQVQGNVASGSADSGSPVKVGGVYNTTPPTLTNGQRGDLQLDNRGKLHVAALVAVATPADAVGNAMQAPAGVDSGGTQQSIIFQGRHWLFNGTTWDRARGDTTGAYVVEQASAVGGYSFSNLKANATTTIKSGAGKLHSISINTKGITNTVTVYDNTAGSGTTIATIDSTLGQSTLLYDLAFATGLTIVIAGGTAADVTITYK